MQQIKGIMLNKMLHLMIARHDGQFDKGGNPYFLHPLAVMMLLNTDDEELQCIGLGHDLIEDTKTTYHELREMGFSERVINGIRCMTKIPVETYDEYRAKVKSNRDSILGKIADLKHNSDIRRLKVVSNEDIDRIVKYHRFYIELQVALNEI